MDLKEIETLIKDALPDAVIDIQDLAGDGNHYSATITSSKGKMGNELHALAIKTKEKNESGN